MIVAATLLAIALLVIVIIACKLRRKLQSAARFGFYSDIYAILQLYCFVILVLITVIHTGTFKDFSKVCLILNYYAIAVVNCFSALLCFTSINLFLVGFVIAAVGYSNAGRDRGRSP